MAGITAADVKALRQQTGLPMMDCKQALTECDGDVEKAVDWLRKKGLKTLEKRSGRDTEFGRFGLYTGADKTTGAMVELKCESAPVASNDEFVQLANDLAKQLATGPGAADAEALLDQNSPSKDGVTLREQRDELFNRIREVFKVGRMVRYEGPCGGYSHNAGTVSGVLLQIEGGSDEASKDICMHIAAMRPKSLSVDDLDSDVVAKEREILAAAARSEGKPDNIVDKVVDGQIRKFYAESVLTEQDFVVKAELKATVGKYAEQNEMKLVAFTHWELGG